MYNKAFQLVNYSVRCKKAMNRVTYRRNDVNLAVNRVSYLAIRSENTWSDIGVIKLLRTDLRSLRLTKPSRCRSIAMNIRFTFAKLSRICYAHMTYSILREFSSIKMNPIMNFSNHIKRYSKRFYYFNSISRRKLRYSWALHEYRTVSPYSTSVTVSERDTRSNISFSQCQLIFNYYFWQFHVKFLITFNKSSVRSMFLCNEIS